MRVSREQAAESKKRIIDSSKKLFKRHGFDGIGVVDLMKAAGLTHGAFYTHFETKDALCAETFEAGLDDLSTLVSYAETVENPREVFCSRYLSVQHKCDLEDGCAVAALGADQIRLPWESRSITTKKMDDLFDQMGNAFFKSSPKKNRRQKAIHFFASLLGTMILARAVNDEQMAEEILQATVKTAEHF